MYLPSLNSILVELRCELSFKGLSSGSVVSVDEKIHFSRHSEPLFNMSELNYWSLI